MLPTLVQLLVVVAGRGQERAGDAAPEGEEEDNIVTTIDEVCVHTLLG